MKLSRLFRSLLKSAIYIMDQTNDQFERASDRASEVANGVKNAVRGDQDTTLRNALSFVAGIGVGAALGVVLAPASGAETRASISHKVQDIGEKIRDGFSTETAPLATGTDGA